VFVLEVAFFISIISFDLIGMVTTFLELLLDDVVEVVDSFVLGVIIDFKSFSDSRLFKTSDGFLI